MPRVKYEGNQNQVAALKEQLKISQQELKISKKEMTALQAYHAQAVEEAARIGYQLGLLEAEERDARCKEVIAKAVVDFEKRYAKKASPDSVLARARAKINVSSSNKDVKAEKKQVVKKGSRKKVVDEVVTEATPLVTEQPQPVASSEEAVIA